MARCATPFKKDGLYMPCGKCHECKARRISTWSFRLMKEAERSSSALFVTLTYDNDHVPLTSNNMMTLKKEDVQNFFKKLRKLTNEKIKYYVAGEYGERTHRPHYHIILFNANHDIISDSWQKGDIHYGDATEASSGYTLKYISKSGRVPRHNRDYRLPEFSLMSKKMGDNYLTLSMIKWHKADILNRCYVNLKDGKKITMPRYYRDKIYTKHQMLRITNHLNEKEQKEWDKMSQEKKSLKMSKDDLILINKIKHNDENRKTKL